MQEKLPLARFVLSRIIDDITDIAVAALQIM